jgi:hypothetical protein
MRLWPRIQKTIAGCMALSLFLVCSVVVPAQAALVGTAEILSARDDALARQKVMHFLERQDVIRHLQAWGVGADEAQSRVEAMTPDEIRMLADKIDQMPAGGDVLGFIVGAAVVTFVVLIITDIMGVTDIFTFIKKR